MIEKLNVFEQLKLSSDYFASHLKAMLGFSVATYILLIASELIGGWQRTVFWAVLILAYILWVSFFRFYFGKKPYFTLQSIGTSLIPSTKIFVIMLIITGILIFLPFVPLFFGFDIHYLDKYINFLQKYQQDSPLIDLLLNILFVLIAPTIFYRPSFAFISSVIGRSPSIRTAWHNSKGNYWPIVGIMFCLNFSMVFFIELGQFLSLSNIGIFAPIAVLFVYFNIVLAKSYEFFFLQNVER